MWFFLNSLLPSFYKLRGNYKLKGPRIKYGFNSRTEFKYTDELSTIRGVRPGHFTGNEVTLYGVYEGVSTMEVPIYDGLTKDLVDTDGRLDIMLTVDLLAKYAVDKKKIPELISMMRSGENYLNSVSLFYNLLRLYYIAANAEVTYDPKANYYDNGHVKIVNAQWFTTHLEKLKLGQSVSFNEADVSIDKEPLAAGDFEMPAYSWTGRITNGEIDIISKAAGKWDQSAPFALAHSSPELAETVVINPTGSDVPIENTRTGSSVILDVINNLVTTNRLYTDFAYAYLMITQIYVSPVPRSAEAAAWVVGSQTVNMPQLKAIAGYMPLLTENIPFARRSDWMDTYKNWRKETGTVLFHSIALVEAAYVELANVIKLNSSEEINADNFVETSVDGSPVMFGGIVQDVSLTATRYGCKVDLPYALSCGLNRSQGLVSRTTIKVPVTITDAEAHNFYALENAPAVVAMENAIVVTQLTAAMYPVMTYGINEDAYYANGLKDKVTAKAFETDAGDIVFTNIVDFTKFMNIMRMMGHDVVAKEAISGKNITNWADNASGRFLYTDVNLDESAQVFVIKREMITKRANAWVDIGQKRGSITLEYAMSELRMNVFNGGETLQLAGKVVGAARAPPGVKELIRDAGGTEGLKFIPLAKTREQDFRLVRYTAAPKVRAVPTLPSPGELVESGENEPDEGTPGGNLDIE